MCYNESGDIMWGSKFSRVNKEIICDRIGKEPYSKELTNLILTRIDMETTFVHHAFPDALDFLRKLFGDVDFGSNFISALEVLKRYYKAGNKLYEEYMEYVNELGSINETEELLLRFLEEKESNEESFDASHGRKLIEVYERYQYGLFNIVKLDEKIADYKRQENDEEIMKVGEAEPKRKKGVMKMLDYFKGIGSNIK